MEILVTGGRGALGRHVVRRLTDAGQQVRLLSRRPRPADAPPGVTWLTGDQTDPDAMRAALVGVEAVVHCATNYLRPREDLVGARVLAQAASHAGRPHVVCLGIVGSDRIPYSYYRAKVQVETILTESGLPVTVQRATQFHELFVLAARLLGRSPIVPVPAGFRAQPIAAVDVAERVAELAVGPALGRAPDLGGPVIHDMADLVKTALRRLGKRRLVVPIPLVGKIAHGFRAGYNLAPEHAEGRMTFEEFLDQTGVAA
ncbi:SDR family oxidoreductase [Tenggerimyces flavus]|uniref:SDR family oxidoreductase n=1 Tax=Tenggerimyces flavus TaxID=1708749 RepID=A0ABV7YMP6_9ACTN|nr:NAD(P)H-binding protein [Tenggerimyces flavus]MBM7786224.1 uncharacterized protein YbjT (DUF2867 family) [Tenggerimyces flavus]